MLIPRRVAIQKMIPLTISERTIEDLALAANLRLSRERARILAPVFREFLASLKKLDELDLKEEPLQLVLRVRQEGGSPGRTS